MQRPGPRTRILNRDPRNPKVSTQVSSWLNFNPLSLSPNAWWDASDTTTITSSGSPAKVSQWDDKSGNGYHLTQGTSLAQPITGASLINNLNVLNFDPNNGTNFTAGDVLDLGTDNITILAVCRFLNNTLTGNTLLGKYKVTPDPGSYIVLRESGVLRSGYRNATVNTTANLTSFTDTTPFLWSIVIDRETAFIQQRYRKAITQTLSFTADNASSRDISTHFYVGHLRNSTDTGFVSGYGFWGSTAEIIICLRKLNEGELIAASNYLTQKWGLLY